MWRNSSLRGKFKNDPPKRQSVGDREIFFKFADGRHKLETATDPCSIYIRNSEADCHQNCEGHCHNVRLYDKKKRKGMMQPNWMASSSDHRNGL